MGTHSLLIDGGRIEAKTEISHMHVRQPVARRWVIVAVMFAAVSAASATPVTFSFVIHGASPAKEATILLRSLQRVKDLTAAPSISKMVAVGEPATLDLAPSFWSLTVVSQELWHRPQIFRVGKESITVVADLSPAGTVSGAVDSKNATVPSEMNVRFHTSAGDVHDESNCPIEANHFRCVVPAGILDLRMRARGFVTEYRSGAKIDAGRDLDAGTIVLRPGASIVGHVKAGGGLKLDENVRVIATADSAGSHRATVAGIDGQGFFHIDVLPPGTYTVVAVERKPIASQSVTLNVYPGAEAELKDPLTLETPKFLTVTIDPPLDPMGKTWTVGLTRNIGLLDSEVLGRSHAPAASPWRSPPLMAGRYTVSVGPHDGEAAWHSEDIEVGTASPAILVHVNARPLHGHITLGEKGLAANLHFRSGSAATDATSDDTGYFDGFLPSDSLSWDVTVTADFPRIKRSLKAVAVSADGAVTIGLPNTAIQGTVVDRSGNPVPSAGIVVSHAGEPVIQKQAEKDGSFSVYGLDPDTYLVQAKAFKAASASVKVEVTNESAPEPMELVLIDSREIDGHVTSDFGPVVGADVWVTPVDVPETFGDHDRTNGNGQFAVAVPPATGEIDVVVAAPGFAYRMFRTKVQEGQLTVHVDQRGGSVALQGGDGNVHLLMHGGSQATAESIAQIWPSEKSSSALVLQSMEPGPYVVCAGPPINPGVIGAQTRPPNSRCAAGFLAPYGMIEMKLPAPH
jgi:hypothetical protein